MAERQSPDGNKHPRGTPEASKRPKSLYEVAHQEEQLQSQKLDGHAHTKNAITLRACTTSSASEVLIWSEVVGVAKWRLISKGSSMRKKLQISKDYAESPEFLPALELFI